MMKTLIVSAVRDEAPYVLEWIAYHRAIGFTNILIYSNDCRDGTDLLLDRLQYLGVVCHERNKVLRRGPHKSALKAALSHPNYLSADWVFVCDPDEFLNIKVGERNLDDLIGQFPGAEAIPVCWRMFSNEGHVKLFNDLTVETLTDAESSTPQKESVGRFVKTLFRPSEKIEKLGVHAPHYLAAHAPEVVWGTSWPQDDDINTIWRPKSEFGYEVAQINHYALRSVEAFLLKRDRGDGNATPNRLELDYWKRWCRGGEQDRSILGNLPRLRLELESLLSDPIIKALHTGVLEFHRQRIEELLATNEYRLLKDSILAFSPSEKADETEALTAAVPASVGENVPCSEEKRNTAAIELSMKAPGRHANRLKLLELMPKNGKCAEIGVWNGGFSQFILEVTQPDELTLIDPWDLISEQSDGEKTHKMHSDDKFMAEMFSNVGECYGDMKNVKIIKGFSADVLSEFPDDYFDWVYIDGNHLYEFVKDDVRISFKKVKSGGVIAGDDFFWKRNDRMHVREAVLDAMKEQGMQNRPRRLGQQFYITVP